MPATQADFGDVHLDVVSAVIVAAVGVEGAPGGPLGGVQDVFQRGQRLVGQVRHLEVDGSARGIDLGFDLGHHLPRPVVGVDEPLAVRVDLISAKGIGDVRARRAVVILDQRIDLEALDAGQLRARVVGHRVAVAGVGGVLVGAVQVTRCGQAEPAARAGGQNDRLGADRDEFTGAGVQRRGAHGPALVRQHPDRHQPVLDLDLLAHRPLAQHAIQRLLDVLALGHRQHVGARAVHPAHRVFAMLVLLELHAVALQPLHHREAPGGGLIHGALVDDSVVGAGDLGDVVLGFGLARDHGVVDAVHAHRQGSGVAHVGLLQQQHLRAALRGRQRGHGARGAAADDQDVTVEPDRGRRVGNLHHAATAE